MVSDRQVRLLRKKRMEGKTLEAAAAAAGMSERTARTWERGALPSATKEPRTWRTRPDPFVEVWATEIEPLLVADKDGQARGEDHLRRALPREAAATFEAGQLRTLQRRVREWRAEHGPDKEVFFPQEHVPGREAPIDFTHATELGVTIAGVLFVHLLFEFVLASAAGALSQLAFGETFEALVAGLQGALWALGGVLEMVRSGQSLGRDPRAPRTPAAGADGAVRRRARALRAELDAHPAGRVAREWRRRAGARPAQERAGAGARRAGQPRLRERRGVRGLRRTVRRGAPQPARAGAARRGAAAAAAAAGGAECRTTRVRGVVRRWSTIRVAGRPTRCRRA